MEGNAQLLQSCSYLRRHVILEPVFREQDSVEGLAMSYTYAHGSVCETLAKKQASYMESDLRGEQGGDPIGECQGSAGDARTTWLQSGYGAARRQCGRKSCQ